MAVRGCAYPDHLYYDVINQVWYEALADGTVRAGMTPAALAMSGELLAFTPKRPGREVEKGKWFATIESGKWVGPARGAFDATVVAYNESLMEVPRLANRDPYGQGWMTLLRPNAADWRQALVTGAAIGPAMEAWMDAEKFPGCGG